MTTRRVGEPSSVLGYVRVSLAREEMISPEIQRNAIKDWARRNGMRIVDWIVDLDQSGRNFKRKVMKAIERLENGEAGGIAVYRYDRWGRNAVESLANVQRVEMIGGSVISATEPLDPETAIGRYNRTNAFALAEMQSDIIGENWKAALNNRVQNKLPPTGGKRFGYVRKGRIPDPITPHRFRRDPNDPEGERYEPDPEQGPILAEMYRRYVVGSGSTSILKWINGMGIKTNRGGTWTDQTLFSVLDSGFGAGLLRMHDSKCRCGRAINRCPHSVYVQGAHKPVITMETWEAYLRRRKKMSFTPARSRMPVYPLSSLINCGDCGHRLSAMHALGIPGYAYRCTVWTQHRGCTGAWVRRIVAEQAVRDQLTEWSASLSAVASVTKARQQTVMQARNDRERLIKEMTRIDKALTRLATQRALDDQMPDSVYESARDDLLAERARIEAALNEAIEVEDQNVGEFLPIIETVLTEWDFLPPARLRDLLAAVISEIKVHRTGIRKPPRIEIIPVWMAHAVAG